ncbi:MAG: thioredoxin domain-containing protein [Myxococcales bacterium]|nr:thioredoxin domain-containing protein [Myxococcales bacterium]
MRTPAFVISVGFCVASCNQSTSSPAPKAAAPSAPASSGASDQPVPDDRVVATWEGGQLTYGELRAKAAGELRKARTEYLQRTHQIEEQMLENLVLDEIISANAKAAGQEKQAYVESLLVAPQVSDEQVQAFYDENKDRIGDLESNKERIRQFLGARSQQESALAVFEKLKKDANAEMKLPAPDLPKASFTLEGRPFKGPADAKVTVVEFSDFQCPYCARAGEPIAALTQAYPEDVKVYFLHFPLTSIHPQAKPAAVAAECAHRQDKFWAYHDKLFENQRAIDPAQFAGWAGEIGLDVEKFKTCLEDESVMKRVDEDMAMGEAAGVAGTPSFFINGVQQNGFPTPDSIKPFVES